MKAEKPREIAFQVLLDWENGAGFAENLLNGAMARVPLDPLDRAFCREIVLGTIRWRATLDWLIDRRARRRSQRPQIRILLRLGLYQLLWLDRTPDYAAVDQTVLAARKIGCGLQAGFINALLRSYVRHRKATLEVLADLRNQDPALGYSHPSSLVERWQRRWGPRATRQLLEWNNQIPLTFARRNGLKSDAAHLLRQWDREGVRYEAFQRDWLPENLVYHLCSHPPLQSLPSLQWGWFYIQDPSTLLAVRSLGAKPGDSVLDLCAAPGGKTTYIAQELQNRGRLVALDRDRLRLHVLRENCTRLGATCVEISCSTEVALPERGLFFDRILVDAPCSNTGALRRRVDLRWRWRVEEVQRLKRIQGALLNAAAGQLKPGGILVYSTCSLEPEENREVIQEFLSGRPEFRLEAERELVPFKEKVDGAHVARLRRTD